MGRGPMRTFKPRHSTKKRKKEKNVPKDIRRFVYERDNWNCVMCPGHRSGQQKIGLHHLIGKDEYDPRIFNFKNGLHDVRNLVTVCKKHHDRIHTNPETMRKMLEYQVVRFGEVRVYARAE
jgi:5-methylcytosine-specific restriction endonuclease McrA